MASSDISQVLDEISERSNLGLTRHDGGGVVYFVKSQLGAIVPSTHVVAPLSERFVAAIEQFVKTEQLDLVTFEKHQRKDDVAQEYRARRRDLRGFAPRAGGVFLVEQCRSEESTTMKIDADEKAMLESVERGEWKSVGGGKRERMRYARSPRRLSARIVG
jgi:hypothetical protein